MLDWIKDYLPIIFSAVIAVLAILTIVWRISRYFTKVETSIEKLDKRIDDINKALNRRIDDVRDDMRDFSKKILDRLSMGQRGSDDGPVSTSQSPIRLTEYGTKLAGKSQAEAIVETYADRAEVEQDMNEYQIQQACFNFAQLELLDILETADRDRVEKLAFNEGIHVAEILKVIGIKMRDYHLAKLGKEVVGIDKHTPD